MMNGKFNFNVLLFSRIISELGSAMFTFALSLFVLDTTGSAIKYSFILSASIFARVIANTIVGIIVDRVHKKNLIIIAEILNSAVLIGLYLLFALDMLTWGYACIGSLLLSIFGSLLRVSINASVPELLEEKSATKANALFQTIGALVLIIGPLLASLFYERSAMSIVLVWSAVSYAISGILLSRLHYPKKEKVHIGRSVIADLRETMHYIQNYSFLSFFLKVSSFMNFLMYPMMILVLPFITYQVLRVSGSELAIIQACWALGMICGSLTMLRVPTTHSFIRRFFDLLIILGIIITGWSISDMPWIQTYDSVVFVSIYSVMVFVIGMLQMFVQVPIYTYFQFRISEEYRGRVWGLANTLTDISAPLGLWAFGLLLEGIYWMWVPILSGSIIVIYAALMKSKQAVRRIDRELGC